MRLAGPAVAQSNYILAGDDIFATGEFERQRLVPRWNRAELECVETLHRREEGNAGAPLGHAPFAIDEFELGKAQKEADMIETFVRRLGGDFVIFTQVGRQFEL